MNEEGYLISKDSATRLSGMLDAFDNNQIAGQWRPDRGDYGFGRTTSIVQTVEITGAAISAGYYPGKTKNWNNITQAWVDGPACRVREASGGSLTNGQTYTGAKLVGQDTISSVNYLVFQVKSTLSGAVLGYYAGGTVSLTGGGAPYYNGYTEINLAAGGTMKLGGCPWGYDAYKWWNVYHGTEQPWRVWVQELTDYTYKYQTVPFLINYVTLAATYFNSDYYGYGVTSVYPFLYAFDPIKLIPLRLGQAGWYPCIVQHNQGVNGYVQNSAGTSFSVINCRQTDMSGQWYIPPIVIPQNNLGTL